MSINDGVLANGSQGGRVVQVHCSSRCIEGESSRTALSQALGVDHFETEGVLHKHNVTEDLGTVEEHLAEVRSVEAIRASRR